jgi:hypothetical protein
VVDLVMDYFAYAVGVAALVLIASAVARQRRAAAAPRPGPDEPARRDDGAAPCRLCDRPAAHATPAIRHARPLLDGLLRRLGVVPVVRFQLVLDLGLAPADLCELHFYRARSLLEVQLGSVPAAYAEWVDEQTRRLIEYQRDGLHARLAADEGAPAAAVDRSVARVVERPRQRAFAPLGDRAAS